MTLREVNQLDVDRAFKRLRKLRWRSISTLSTSLVGCDLGIVLMQILREKLFKNVRKRFGLEYFKRRRGPKPSGQNSIIASRIHNLVHFPDRSQPH